MNKILSNFKSNKSIFVLTISFFIKIVTQIVFLMSKMTKI